MLLCIFGEVLLAGELSNSDIIYMNIREGMKMELSQGNIKYLSYHRKYIFKDSDC